MPTVVADMTIGVICSCLFDY